MESSHVIHFFILNPQSETHKTRMTTDVARSVVLYPQPFHEVTLYFLAV